MHGEKYDCLVSIGIVTYNQKVHCRNLVEALIKYGPSDIRIFVYDNNPDPPITDQLPRDSRIEIILDDTNPGYIKPNNRMAAACRSKYHIVSNDDVEVGPHWYEECEQYFLSDAKLACLGAPGTYGYLTEEFQGYPVGPGQSPDYVEGWWMFIPRHILDRYGLFDEANLRIATTEDSNFCLKLKECGWNIKVADLPVNHLESKTKKTTGRMNWGDENLAWGAKRWEHYLKNPARVFPKHRILLKGPKVSLGKLRELRWRYPHSEITLEVPSGVVDHVRVGNDDQEYSLII